MSIREPIKLKDLMEEGVVFDIDTDDLHNFNEPTEDYDESILKFMNMTVAGDIKDENNYIEGQPFEVIASKMITLTNDRSVLKHVLREGYGSNVKDGDIVRVHYNGYIEFQAEPFDCTYARRKPHQFVVNNGEVIIGLDIAVQSMKLNEKSQFLLKPAVAYGKMGCLSRVPPDSDILFEIELLEIVSVGTVAEFEGMPLDKQQNFANVYHYCLALCSKGKDLFSRNVGAAIKEYNKAVGKLEHAVMEDYNDEMKQQELLHKLYVNLVVCYMKIGEPRKVCTNFNKLQNFVKGTSLKVPAKAYYNNARALRMLGDYGLAKKRLDCAYKLDRNNTEIHNELIILDKEIKDTKAREIELAKTLLNS